MSEPDSESESDSESDSESSEGEGGGDLAEEGAGEGGSDGLDSEGPDEGAGEGAGVFGGGCGGFGRGPRTLHAATHGREILCAAMLPLPPLKEGASRPLDPPPCFSKRPRGTLEGALEPPGLHCGGGGGALVTGGEDGTLRWRLLLPADSAERGSEFQGGVGGGLRFAPGGGGGGVLGTHKVWE